MQSTLFALFNAADTIMVEGYEVEAIEFFQEGARLEYCGGDEKVFFRDQSVTLAEGGCTAKTAEDPQYDGMAEEELHLTFHVTRLIMPADLLS